MIKLRFLNLLVAEYIANNVDGIMDYSAVSEDKHSRAKIDINNIEFIEVADEKRGTYLCLLRVPYTTHEITGMPYAKNELTYFVPTQLIVRNGEGVYEATDRAMMLHYINMTISHALATISVVSAGMLTNEAMTNYLNAMDNEEEVKKIIKFFNVSIKSVEEEKEEVQQPNIEQQGTMDKSSAKQEDIKEVNPFGTNIDVKEN